jgi:cytochrome bd-type quinol oxidase subunit 2
MGDLNQISQRQEDKKEKASFVIGIVAICFAADGAGLLIATLTKVRAEWAEWAVWAVWAVWALPFVGIVLSIASLVFKRSAIGWCALSLSFFSVVCLFISAFLMMCSLYANGP